VLLCLCHVRKAWAENVIKKTASIKEGTKVLCGLGKIMYS
jgi:hypothetical protein